MKLNDQFRLWCSNLCLFNILGHHIYLTVSCACIIFKPQCSQYCTSACSWNYHVSDLLLLYIFLLKSSPHKGKPDWRLTHDLPWFQHLQEQWLVGKKGNVDKSEQWRLPEHLDEPLTLQPQPHMQCCQSEWIWLDLGKKHMPSIQTLTLTIRTMYIQRCK